MVTTQTSEPLFFRGDYQKPEKVDWLWYPYIPYGRLTLIQGDPGDGKSTFILNSGAKLTKEEDMPYGYHTGSPQDVIYQCREDNYADTTRPRLDRAGADVNKIIIINDHDSSLTVSDERVEETIKQTGARLAIFDPIQSYVVKESDMMLAGRVRKALTGLVKIARKYNCAVVLIGHMNKRHGGKSLYRSLGSIDLIGLVKSVLMVQKDPDVDDLRIVTHEKITMAKPGKTFAFRLTDFGIEWDMSERVSPRSLFVDDYEDTEISSPFTQNIEPSALLAELLADGPKPSLEIQETVLSTTGISKRTFDEIKKNLGVKSFKINNVWHMGYERCIDV